MRELSFTVHGTPAPQGSKIRNRYGGMREANPNTIPWRQEVKARAAEALGLEQAIAGPVELEAVFTFTRPKAHWRTGRHRGLLKDSAPALVSTTPDLDKLLRAVGDALTGSILRDDAQIARVAASKVYGTPGLSVTIRELG